MARELLRPEDATNWDDFLDRIALERSVRSARKGAFPTASWLVLTICLLGICYATAWEGTWWLCAAATVPLVFVVRTIVRAARRTVVDNERLKELDQLELAWKLHVERSRL